MTTTRDDFEARLRHKMYIYSYVPEEVLQGIMSTRDDTVREVVGEIELNQYGGLSYTNRKEYRNELRFQQLQRAGLEAN